MRRLTAIGLAVATALALPAGWLMAQGSGSGNVARGPFVSSAVRHDVSRPLREIVVPASPFVGVKGEINPIIAPQRPDRPQVPHQPDPALQDAFRPVPEAALTPAPLLTFEGVSDDINASLGQPRVVPPDTEGDIGPNHYVQWVNLAINIWTVQRDPSGNPTGVTQVAGFPKAGNAVFSGFGGNCQNTNSGDPIVLYDHLADRWLLSQFAVVGGSIVSQCVALSTTPDPTGSYMRWEFDITPGSNDENDYPKFGLMPNAYYISSRDFPSTTSSFAGAGAFDRAAMLAGAASPTFIKFSLPCLSNDCPDAIQPPHLEGPPPASTTPGYFTRAWDDDFDGPLTGADGYRVWRFDPDFVTPSNSSFVEQTFVVGTPYDSTMCGFFQRNCIPQASSTVTLDPVDELQMYRAQYRHFANRDTIVLNTTADATGTNIAGIRWAVLGNANPGTSGTWSLEQDGTYAPADGQNRWMGSAAMDGSENIAVGYSVSSGNTNPAIRYTTRTSSDAPGTLPGGEVEMQAGGGAQTQANRWGDYSTMSVDPVVDCTFWYTQEYYQITGGFDFNTRVGVFQIPDCGVCVPDETPEATCNDGRDNDCDGDIDCADADCASDPVCQCDNDGVCEPGEDCNNCPSDCVSGTSSGAVCGNGVCEAGDGEDCVTCAADCNGVQNGKPSNRFCCGFGGTNPVGCGDAACTTGGFSCTETPVGGGGTFCCGQNGCEPGENCGNCALDCTVGAEVCSGGVDEDCNGFVDCADSACTGDPACPTCGGNGASCSVNSDCCSNKCRSGTCRGN